MDRVTSNGILIIFSAILIVAVILVILAVSTSSSEEFSFSSPLSLSPGGSTTAIIPSSSDWRVRFADGTLLGESTSTLTTSEIATIDEGLNYLQPLTSGPYSFGEFYRSDKGVNVISFNSLSSETVALLVTRQFLNPLPASVDVTIETTEDFEDFVFSNLQNLVSRTDTTYNYAGNRTIQYSSGTIIFSVGGSVVDTFHPLYIAFPATLTTGDYVITIINSQYRAPVLQLLGEIIPEV